MSQYTSETIFIRIGRNENHSISEHQDDSGKASKILSPKRRHQHLNQRAWIRHNLAELLDCDPLSVQIAYTKDGRPEIAGGPALSITHDGAFSALALGSQGPIGLDLQHMSERRLTAFNSYFNMDCSSVQASQLWTRMESIGKWQGQGLNLGLRPLLNSALNETLPDIQSLPNNDKVWFVECRLQQHALCLCTPAPLTNIEIETRSGCYTPIPIRRIVKTELNNTKAVLSERSQHFSQHTSLSLCSADQGTE